MELSKTKNPELGVQFIYTLQEASAILETSESKLLLLMANGVINGLVFFGLIEKLNGSVHTKRKGNNGEIYISFMKKNILDINLTRIQNKNTIDAVYLGYFGLNKSDAKNILLAGAVEQKKFLEILHLSQKREDIYSRNRRQFAKNFHRSICEFPFYSFRSGEVPISGTNATHRRIVLEHSINITDRSVYLDLGEILYLMRNYYLPRQPETLASMRYRQFFKKITGSDLFSKNRSLFEFKRCAFHSQKLVDLIQVSIHFWGTLYFEFESYQKIDHPRNEVQQYLVKHYNFDQKLARTAAKLIFPLHAKGRPEISSQLKYLGLTTSKLEILINASTYFYTSRDLKDRETFPHINTIEQWFKEKHGFPSYIALASAEIIEPTKEDIDDFLQINS